MCTTLVNFVNIKNIEQALNLKKVFAGRTVNFIKRGRPYIYFHLEDIATDKNWTITS